MRYIPVYQTPPPPHMEPWLQTPANRPCRSEFIGVLGSFFRGGQQILSAKTQSCSAKKISSQGGGQILQFCSAKLMYHSFLSQCSASVEQKLLNDDSKTGKNGRKIGKHDRNQTKMAGNRLDLAEKMAKYEGKGECWPCSVSAFFNFLILFCQTVNFFSAKPPNSVLPC